MSDKRAGDAKDQFSTVAWIRSRGPFPAKDGGEPPLPSPGQMAKNLARAIANLTTAILHGKPGFVSMPLWRARRAACEKGQGLTPEQTSDGHCDQYRKSDGRCAAKRCGCLIVAKSAIATEKCPLDRWPRDEEV